MPTPEQVKAVVDAYVAAYGRNDRQAVLDLFHPDAVWHDPVGAPPHVGHEGIGTFWDQAHEMAQSIVLEPSHVMVGGDEAAMVFEIRVDTGAGTMVMDAVEIFTLDDDGKIVLLKAYWDMTKARTES
jgi:steroid delta-isomerase